MVASIWWIVHPLGGKGYQFWSGIGSDLAYVAVFLGFWRHHNCHVRGCWRIRWHVDKASGHPVCRHHHPRGGGVDAPD